MTQELLRERRKLIRSLGPKLGPDVLDKTRSLFIDEQRAIAASREAPVVDIEYGPDARHRLDIYAPDSASEDLPVLVWVHGGGFLKEAKSDPSHPFNAHVGHFAARNGFLGVVINYRLAPDNQWPSGPEDLALLMGWLQESVAAYGADATRIVLMGTSAGAAHIAGYLASGDVSSALRGTVLLSGLYGFTPLTDRDRLYFGEDPGKDADRMPKAAVIETTLPLFVACAEFDLPRFQAETLGLMQARLDRHGQAPRGALAIDHNHYSIGCHLGGEDHRLSNEIIAFARDCVDR